MKKHNYLCNITRKYRANIVSACSEYFIRRKTSEIVRTRLIIVSLASNIYTSIHACARTHAVAKLLFVVANVFRRDAIPWTSWPLESPNPNHYIREISLHNRVADQLLPKADEKQFRCGFNASRFRNANQLERRARARERYRRREKERGGRGRDAVGKDETFEGSYSVREGEAGGGERFRDLQERKLRWRAMFAAYHCENTHNPYARVRSHYSLSREQTSDLGASALRRCKVETSATCVESV